MYLYDKERGGKMETNQEIKMEFRDYGIIVIPKGTQLTHNTACGIDKDYHFVADLSWIQTYDDGTPQHGLIHDATYYGINIPKQFVDDEV